MGIRGVIMVGSIISVCLSEYEYHDFTICTQGGDNFLLAAAKPLVASLSPTNTKPYNRRAKQKKDYVVLSVFF